jgi:hypothetical protein
MAYEEEDACQPAHVGAPVYRGYEEEDTCMSCEEEDTCQPAHGMSADAGLRGERQRENERD